MKKLLVVSMLSIGFLAGCASSSSPDVISRDNAQRMETVSDATVVSVRSVKIEGNQSGIGATVGGVVGGIGGYAGSGISREAQVLGVLGAVGGAMIGNAVEKFSTGSDALEIIVQMQNGQRGSIVQEKGVDVFVPGQRVLVVNSSGKLRVVRN